MAFQPPPLTGNADFDRWMRLFYKQSGAGGSTDHALLSNLNSSGYSHPTGAQLGQLIGGTDTTLHFHAADRDRANHTGTQTSATISDFTTAVQQVLTGSTSSSAWLEAQVYGR